MNAVMVFIKRAYQQGLIDENRIYKLVPLFITEDEARFIILKKNKEEII